MYASHIWLNSKNVKEINSLYYKILKSSIGAVLNIRHSYAEVILGLPPLHIMNEINSIKHFLKINMTQHPVDRLREAIAADLQIEGNLVSHSLRKVYKYLKWKLETFPQTITNGDDVIINNNNVEEFFMISPASCKYTKGIMTKYAEHLWYKSLQNEIYLDGQNIVLEPKCLPIPIPKEMNRNEEVMMVSMMYPNNLLNSSLHAINSEKFPSPMCKCGQSQQTAHHILFQCGKTDISSRQEAFNLLQTIVGEAEATVENSLVLLKACKNQKFIQITSRIIQQQMENLNCDVQL